ncbi:MAG: glutamate--tRNA ligase [Acidimicrobiia bacterium]
MTPIRVRYSPAPSGEIHVGNARTALFNWLFARHVGGVFVLRIEDTNREKSTEAAIAGVQDTLRWLGMDWDEGPVLQSGLAARHLEAVEQLLADGRAYRCWCTEAELRERNEAEKEAGRPPGYDGHCRELDDEHVAAYEAEGRTSVVRFRTPDEGVSRFTDVVRGEVSVEWSTIRDFVILRSDGSPLFFLANAVDDLDMGITHVIRGEDLIDTTHRVLALRDALGGGPPPVYAHLPLVLAADRAKLSKRHGADAVEDFRSLGYLPEAIVNYLALLGWSPGESAEEVLSLDELVAAFDLDRVTNSAAVFDQKKLDWVNGEWMRRLATSDLASRIEPAVREAAGERFDADVFAHAVAVGQERSSTLVQLTDQMDFLFVGDDAFAIDDEAWARLEKVERVGEVLDTAIAHVEACEWSADALNFVDVLKNLGVKPGKAMVAIYVAVEGRAQGLPAFDAIWMLGRERALLRLRAARERLGAASRAT